MYIYRYKMLILATGEIREIESTYENTKTIFEFTSFLARLNNEPLIYGVVYFIDESCFEESN